MKYMMFLLALACVAPADAQEPEPKKEPGQLEPWQNAETLRPGDRWADIRLKVDKAGRAIDCDVVRSNIKKPEMRFWVCRAFTQDWKGEPIMENGVPVEGYVHRKFIMPGRATREAWNEEKKAQRN